jgi:hypothetical protein
MATVRASLKRQARVIVTLTAAMVIALTSFVVASPSADAAYRWHCTISHPHVRRGHMAAVICRHGHKEHRGRAYVITHRHHHRRHLIEKRFRTGRRGNALFGFRVKMRTPLGRHKLFIRNGNELTHVFIVVKRKHARDR